MDNLKPNKTTQPYCFMSHESLLFQINYSRDQKKNLFPVTSLLSCGQHCDFPNTQ